MRPDTSAEHRPGAGGRSDANASRLREFVLAQALEPGGAVVLLFTSATLSADDGSAGAGDPGPHDGVAITATDLGLGAHLPDLFTTDAYLLQSALGERLLPGDA